MGRTRRRERRRRETHIICYTEKLKAKDNMEDIGIDGRIILRHILKAPNVKLSTGFSCPLVRVCSEHGNKCSGTIEDGDCSPSE
jgi:hypothetical protein